MAHERATLNNLEWMETATLVGLLQDLQTIPNADRAEQMRRELGTMVMNHLPNQLQLLLQPMATKDLESINFHWIDHILLKLQSHAKSVHKLITTIIQDRFLDRTTNQETLQDLKDLANQGHHTAVLEELANSIGLTCTILYDTPRDPSTIEPPTPSPHIILNTTNPATTPKKANLTNSPHHPLSSTPLRHNPTESDVSSDTSFSSDCSSSPSSPSPFITPLNTPNKRLSQSPHIDYLTDQELLSINLSNIQHSPAKPSAPTPNQNTRLQQTPQTYTTGQQPTPLKQPHYKAKPTCMPGSTTLPELLNTSFRPPIKRNLSLPPEIIESEHDLADILLWSPAAPPLSIFSHSYPLSNQHASFFEMDNHTFLHPYQALQFTKATHFELDNLAGQILHAKSASAMSNLTKALDKNISSRNKVLDQNKVIDWLNMRRNVMNNILEAKFQQDSTFASYLIDSQPKHISLQIKDAYWGTGPVNTNFPRGSGANTYGLLLMELRQRKSIQSPQPHVTRISTPALKPQTTSHKRPMSDPLMFLPQEAQPPAPKKQATTNPSTTHTQGKDGTHLTLKPTNTTHKGTMPKLPPVTTINDSNHTLPTTLLDLPVFITDSNKTQMDLQLPRNFQILSFTKGKFEQIYKTLRKGPTYRQIQQVVIQSGSLNKDQDFEKTMKKNTKKLLSQAKKSFPQATITLLPVFLDQNNPNTTPEQIHNIRLLNNFLKAHSNLLPLPRDFKPKFATDNPSILSRDTQNQIVSITQDFLGH